MRVWTVLLVLAGAGMGAWVWWEKKHGGAGHTPPSTSVQIFPFMGEQVVRVEVARKDAPPLIVEKKEAVWKLVSPREGLASADGIGMMLRVVDPYSKADPLSGSGPAPDASVHGLDTPRVSVTLADSSGKKVSLAFGNDVIAGGKVFVRRSGTTEVLTIGKWIMDGFNRKPEQLRDRGLCRFHADAARSIAFASEGKSVKVERQGKGWRLTGTADDLADRDVVEEWAARLATLVSPEFKPLHATRAELGLEPPFASFEIVLADRTIRLAVGAPVGEGEERRWVETSEYPGELATIHSKNELALVVRQPETMRARFALPWPLPEFTTLAASGAATFEVRKKDNAWTLVKPALMTRFTPDRVEWLLRELATAPVNGRDEGKTPPEGSIQIRAGVDGSADVVADVWCDGMNTYFRTSDPPRVVHADGTLVWDHLSAAEMFFRDPAVPIELVPLQVERVVIEKDGVVWVDATFEAGKWAVKTVPPGKVLDNTKMTHFRQMWTNLRADTWTKLEKSAPETGLSANPPSWKIRIIPSPDRASSAAERIIIVGNDGPRYTKYALLEGEPGVFLADPSASGQLRGGLWEDD